MEDNGRFVSMQRIHFTPPLQTPDLNLIPLKRGGLTDSALCWPEIGMVRGQGEVEFLQIILRLQTTELMKCIPAQWFSNDLFTFWTRACGWMLGWWWGAGRTGSTDIGERVRNVTSLYSSWLSELVWRCHSSSSGMVRHPPLQAKCSWAQRVRFPHRARHAAKLIKWVFIVWTGLLRFSMFLPRPSPNGLSCGAAVTASRIETWGINPWFPYTGIRYCFLRVKKKIYRFYFCHT